MEDSWWDEVKDSLFDYLDRESEEYSWATMQLSFDNLADCLKPCLLYMGMFPEDARILVSNLISLWIAEDFKLVLIETRIENLTSFLEGLLCLEYLQLCDCVQIRDWCLGDVTFHKLKLLKLVFLSISRWNASEESFPLLETLVISGCKNLMEIPLSFADIPTLKQIKLIRRYNKSLEASAVRIKEEVEAIEGCDRIVITTQEYGGRNIRRL
ncbi:hypothetical protein R3W88_025053 [Solanum pinnatisectum]|uniref:Uncharacterized protein n=1 Tax=Solanum pinnatisectum TaxID=50273 RepID=A0AAV9M598_9SOLN|nr:hypothetical protein R3W88_025053 [Solanum pinnatisectum]